jgi:hypothetical protein
MTKFKKHMLIVAALAVFAGVGAMMNTNHNAAQAAGGPQPNQVEIVKTIPIPVTGPVTANQGSANATPWNVQGLVTNPLDNAVWTRDIAARNHFVLHFNPQISGGTTSGYATQLVPSGKLFVIENVSGQVMVPAGVKVFLTIGTNDTSSPGQYYAVLTSQGLYFNGSTDISVTNQPMRAYADTSVIVQLQSNLISNSLGSGDIWVTGYLVPKP